MKEEIEIAKCSICHQPFERDVNRPEGRLISCPAHSFGEVEPQDLKEHQPECQIWQAKYHGWASSVPPICTCRQTKCCDRCRCVMGTTHPSGICDCGGCSNPNCPCHQAKTNFLQVGRIIECGSCHPEKFEDCKSIEKKHEFKCDCVCHDSPDSGWEEKFDEKFSKWEGGTKSFATILNIERDRIKDFIRDLLSNQRAEHEKD